MPWCVVGNFNLIRLPGERSRGARLHANMRKFSELPIDLELRDMLLLGGPFTWRGGQNNKLKFRLDQYLISDQ